MHGTEGLFDGIDDLMVIDFSSGNYYEIISIVVGRHVVSDIVELDFLGEISITFNWLSEHVVTETVEMA